MSIGLGGSAATRHGLNDFVSVAWMFETGNITLEGRSWLIWFVTLAQRIHDAGLHDCRSDGRAYPWRVCA
jgi:hypothetical protein